MAFEDIPLEGMTNGRYWDPQVKGESIEGNYCGTETYKYGDREVQRIVLDREPEGQAVLPGTKIMETYLKKIEIGDYIKVTYDGIKENKDNPQYSMKLYSMQRDPERKVEYEIPEQ